MNNNIKKTTRGIRIILYVASVLVLSVGISLYFLSTKTNVYFSWTISPPLSAAFLGAGYLASFLLELLSARERVWARARPAVPGVWVFTFLTMIITLMNLDRFHFDAPFFITRLGTWVWLGVYVGVPIALGILWLHQIRQPGEDPPRQAPLASWLRVILLVQGLVMFLVGVAMLLQPALLMPVWPWRLYPLIAQALGAWGIGIGIIALQAAWENDWQRLFPMMLSYAVYGTLQLVNVARFASAFDFQEASSFFYVFFMLTILLVGVYGSWKAWRVNK